MFKIRQSPEAIVRRYVGYLNGRDMDGVASLLHPRCQLIDAFGGRIEGHTNVVGATQRLFILEPKFHVRIKTLVMHEGDVLLRGHTSAERAEFQAEAMWRARVEDGLIICWQSFGPEPSARLAELLGKSP